MSSEAKLPLCMLIFSLTGATAGLCVLVYGVKAVEHVPVVVGCSLLLACLAGAIIAAAIGLAKDSSSR